MSLIAGDPTARPVRPGPQGPAEVLYEWFQNQWWTKELYLALANSENAFVELSDGKVAIYEMPTPQHQRVVGNLYLLLRLYSQEKERGKVYTTPMPVQLWPGKFREPDVMFYRTENLARIGEQYAAPPDWVAEVLSPSTRDIDLVTKAREYALAGIPEYWLIDPETQGATVYVLPAGDETYHMAAEYRPGQRALAQTLTEFGPMVDEVFQT